jgi:hypothetical protein
MVHLITLTNTKEYALRCYSNASHLRINNQQNNISAITDGRIKVITDMLDINIQTPPYEASSLANKLKNKLAKWII